ncbi:sigma 54-interacting transcriptional regulator [Massilia sp. NP310]|uniref:sigma 54-interacting transcriptional regulator n=1 Tax=Massilia sp. NP310 TaxID=2861282 RepID=UPI001C636FFB|nr:sigma 54-interacting transcriptional regulator [Massilia sp. NP310]QYG04195.1 sigma 54-interacting transcriptional regulator [Massilia sp. NP310]
MHDLNDARTLTAPLMHADGAASRLLTLTILWHPDAARIGEQCIASAPGGVLELSRYAPLFSRPGAAGLPLGHGAISREPLRIVRVDDGVSLQAPLSRMTTELNGREIGAGVALDHADLERGQVIALGRTVLLCLHWSTVLPKANEVRGLHGVGSAAVMLRDQVRMVARSDLPVLLLGETGTGKEVVARAIHALGARADARLVTVNMAALNESLAAAELFGAVKGAYTGAQGERKGLFGEANGATLFLDEIGNAPACVQPMLLRVLEGGDYRPLGSVQELRSTARILAATDQRLDGSHFNQALLRRLEGVVIQLAPLRSRREDIGVLIRQLYPADDGRVDLPCSLVAELACYDWPGNVRQLARVLQRAALMVRSGVTPRFDQLVQEPPAADAGKLAGARAARRKPSALSDDELVAALSRHGWILRSTAESLGISRPSLYKLLDRHPLIRRAEGIEARDIGRAWAGAQGDVERCAAALKTLAAPLRRQLNKLGLLERSGANRTDL